MRRRRKDREGSRLNPGRVLINLALAVGALYSVVHVYVSGVRYPLSTPNIGQVIEELQPLYRLFTTGEATVDHPRQYGPIFLMVLHPVYRLDLNDPTLLAWYAYALAVLSMAVAFVATLYSIRDFTAARGAAVTPVMILSLVILWANFSPLYAVLAIKNVELWELAAIAVAGLAVMRSRAAAAGWSIAAGAMMKMLPLVFLPYLLVRNRRAFAHTLAAMAIILTLSQVVYGTAMGWGYFGSLANAAASGEGFGNPRGMIWHENVSIRGVVLKAFGYLEKPDPNIRGEGYTRGYHVVIPESQQTLARTLASLAQGIGLAWAAWVIFRRRHRAEPDRTYWDWAFVAIMMLVMAPQISQDYMVLTLGAFSFVLAGCFVEGRRAPWIEFALAALLVGNLVPRGLFAEAMMMRPIIAWTGYDHLMPAEAYQYFGFPLLGLLLLTRAWWRLAERPAERQLI